MPRPCRGIFNAVRPVFNGISAFPFGAVKTVKNSNILTLTMRFLAKRLFVGHFL